MSTPKENISQRYLFSNFRSVFEKNDNFRVVMRVEIFTLGAVHKLRLFETPDFDPSLVYNRLLSATPLFTIVYLKTHKRISPAARCLQSFTFAPPSLFTIVYFQLLTPPD